MSHTMPELSWWLLCHGICASTTWKKATLVDKCVVLFMLLPVSIYKNTFLSVGIREAKKNKTLVIEVDGSYSFRKHQQLLSQGLPLVPLDIPSTPVTGWEPVNAGNYFEMTSGRNSHFFCNKSIFTKFNELIIFRPAIYILGRRSWKYNWEWSFSSPPERI